MLFRSGLFGSGLSRPLSGIYLNVVEKINSSGIDVFSIDIPSGLFGEDNSKNNLHTIIKAKYTYTFQFPKLSFFLSENESFVGEYFILDIGLHPNILKKIDTPS